MKDEEHIGMLLGLTLGLCLLGGSWLICCGLTKLITLLLGTQFRWYVGTIVWVIITLIFLIRNGSSLKE